MCYNRRKSKENNGRLLTVNTDIALSISNNILVNKTIDLGNTIRGRGEIDKAISVLTVSNLPLFSLLLRSVYKASTSG
jgi:hypothetical protein